MFINLTPHAIVVRNGNEEVTFPASGKVARVSVTTVNDGNIAGFPVSRQVFGEVEGIPSPVNGTFYIVSALVLGRIVGRNDCIAPDTGKGAIRDETGRIIAVTGFVR